MTTIILSTLIINIIILYIKQSQASKTFQKLFEKTPQPAIIINNKTKQIIWHNENFQIHFPEITTKNNLEDLKPKFLFKNIYITSKKNEWIASNINLNKETGLVLTLTNKTEFKWWKDLPFPTAILTQENEIEDENKIFKELIDKSQYKNNITEFKNIIELAKINQKQEFILYSAEGIYPAKIWITQLKDKYLIFIESRIEYIKLKNKAQESQHLQILGQLTSSIMHDFNNLLTCICGFADILDEKIPNDENIQQIQSNIEQATNLSKELLNFIKEKPIEHKTVEPKVYIPKMYNMFSKLLGAKIKLELNTNTEGEIKISETQLERILLNMVINSKDAMQDGGTFKINTTTETITNHVKASEGKVLKPGQYYMIKVIDTGPGIPPQHIGNIFKTFFTTKKKGTGLGLSSCLKIAEHSGGTIILSTSSKGTMFTIMLPIEKKQNSKQEKKLEDNLEKNTQKVIKNDEKTAKNEQKTAFFEQKTAKNEQKITNFEQNEPQILTKKQTIILVEDEEPIRNLVKKALESQYEILDYSEGKSALQAIQTVQFNCLVTDAVLPEIDGIQLANEAKKINPNSVIFVVSGYDLATIETQLPEDTIYIGKPFTLKNLKEIISNNLKELS